MGAFDGTRVKEFWMKERVGVVYRFYCKKDGKSYIGQTLQNPFERIKRHFRGTGNKWLKDALQENGKGSFHWEILEKGIPESKLNERESFWITEYNSVAPNGYNSSVGGEGRGGRKRVKLSEAVS